MSEPYYQFKVLATLESALDSAAWHTEMQQLGKEGWHIAGLGMHLVYLQRLVQEPDADEAPPVEAVPDEETVDPLCGCGCGESVVIGLSAWKLAMDSGQVWYLAGHGTKAEKHDGPYAAAPRARGSA